MGEVLVTFWLYEKKASEQPLTSPKDINPHLRSDTTHTHTHAHKHIDEQVYIHILIHGLTVFTHADVHAYTHAHAYCDQTTYLSVCDCDNDRHMLVDTTLTLIELPVCLTVRFLSVLLCAFLCVCHCIFL